MLLLPLTPPLIYLKLKKFKGPKMDSLSFTQVKIKGNFNGDTRFSRFTYVKIKGNFNGDTRFSRYTQVKIKGNFNGDTRFSRFNKLKLKGILMGTLGFRLLINFCRVVPRTSLSTINNTWQFLGQINTNIGQLISQLF